MKTAEIKVFKFSELSEAAKNAAFEKWRYEKSRWQSGWLAEFKETLDLIEEKSGFKVKTWEFDAWNYHFDLEEPAVNTDDLPAWFPLWEKVESARNAKNTHGKRAIKEALHLYYNLTITEIGYNKNYNIYYKPELDNGRKTFTECVRNAD